MLFHNLISNFQLTMDNMELYKINKTSYEFNICWKF